MGILKGFALGLIGLLLFLSLSVFGFAFTVNSTALNPNFYSSQLDSLDISSLMSEIMTEQITEEDYPEELMTAIIDTVDKLEDPLKEQVSAAIDDTFNYLLGKRENPNLAGTLGDTFFNSEFVASLMAKLDLAALVEDVISQQVSEEGFLEDMGTAVVSAVAELEPTIKQNVPAATDPIFDYLLGKTQSLDLAQILRTHILTSDFVVSLLEALDIGTLSSEFLSEQLTAELPEELRYLSQYVDDAVAEAETTIKEDIGAAADPILDYLLGERQSISIEISLEPIIESLEDSLRKAFLKSPPPELADLSPGQLNQLFEQYFQELTSEAPSTIELDEDLLPADLPAQIADVLAQAEDGLKEARQEIAEGIADAEAGLEQAREYVSQFKLYYNILIGIILLLILLTVLINREVKGATRSLGITFLTYGAIEAIGVFIGRYFADAQIAEMVAQADIPSALQGFVVQLLNDFTAPLQMFSIGLAVAGVVLIVVSFVYPRLRRSSSLD